MRSGPMSERQLGEDLDGGRAQKLGLVHRGNALLHSGAQGSEL